MVRPCLVQVTMSGKHWSSVELSEQANERNSSIERPILHGVYFLWKQWSFGILWCFVFRTLLVATIANPRTHEYMNNVES